MNLKEPIRSCVCVLEDDSFVSQQDCDCVCLLPAVGRKPAVSLLTCQSPAVDQSLASVLWLIVVVFVFKCLDCVVVCCEVSATQQRNQLFRCLTIQTPAGLIG